MLEEELELELDGEPKANGESIAPENEGCWSPVISFLSLKA
ncbi:hypothetical protein FACS189472_11550 [Alphaproteobacteria bacterium]|nr:hypothetical protein FACS189472_11550 [Alphaproteobacteria bacterium]